MAETEQETLKSQLPAVESFICKFLLSIGGSGQLDIKIRSIVWEKQALW